MGDGSPGFSFQDHVEATARWLHNQVAPHFSLETAVPGTAPGQVPSAGHCAVVALLFYDFFGGELISAKVEGQSHWCNRAFGCDIDLTGDQFGRPAVQVKKQGTLYPLTRVRSFFEEVNEETKARARLLGERAGLTLGVL